MKFSTPFITLLAATAACAHYVEKRDELDELENRLDELKKKTGDAKIEFTPKTTSVEDASKSNVSLGADECDKFIAELTPCFPNNKEVTKKNHDEVCQVYNSEKCKKLTQTKITENPACKEHGDMLSPFETLVGVMEIVCGKDGSGNYCPSSQMVTKEKMIDESMVRDSCKSELCLQSTLRGLESIKAQQDYQKAIFGNVNKSFMQKRQNKIDVDKLIPILKEEKCLAEAKSSATSVKIGSSLLLTLGLLFYLF